MTAAFGFKRLGLAVGAIVVAGFAALALMSFLVPTERALDAVKAEIGEVTGFGPVAHGAVEVSLFPYGTVTLTDVALEGERGGAAPFSAERLTARLRLFPLFLGRVEIADIALERPRIVIDIEADGRSNWSALAQALARAIKTGDSRRASLFSEIRVSDGALELRERASGRREFVSGMDMSLAWPSISTTFGATGRFTWRGEPVETSIAISDFHAALVGERSGIKWRLGGAPLKLAFEGVISSRPTLKVEGTLAAESPSLREALRWTGHPQMPGGGFGTFALKAQASVAGGVVSLSRAYVELDGNAAEGVITIAADQRRSVQGTLALAKLDLNPYVSGFQMLVGGNRDWDRSALVIDGLAGIDLDLRLSSKQLVLGNATFGQTAIGASLKGGSLALSIGESNAFGGLAQGSLALAPTADGAAFSARMNFSDVRLQECLSDLFGIKRFEGRGTLAFAVEGAGASVFDIVRSLNGAVTLTSTQGGLTGLDVEQLLRRLERRPLSGGGNFRSGRTPFESVSLSLRIAQGVARIEDMRFEGPSIRLTAVGFASVPARDLDLTGTAALIAGDKANSFELPFIVQGPWDDPLMLPDPQSLIRRSGAAAPLLDARKDRGSRDAIRSAIERITGAAGATPAPASPAATQDR